MGNIFESETKSSNLIKNEELLGYDFVPELLPFREGHMQEISSAIKPMFEDRKGTNLFIYGAPGIGKTASIKWVLRELKEYSSEVLPVYVNCWKNRTKFFIFLEMANQLKLSFTSGKSAEHVLQQIEYRLKGKNAAFVLDEIDKAEDSDFLYQIVEKFSNSTIILASNNNDFMAKMDPRVRSRLMMRTLEFKRYSMSEVNKIIGDRAKKALRADCVDPSIIKQISNYTYSKGDLRVGLFLLRESAKNAEAELRKKIEEKDVMEVLQEIESIGSIDSDKLNPDESIILSAVKEDNGALAGKIYDKYTANGGKASYRSFRRYVDRMVELDILKTEETSEGVKGKSTLIFIK